MPLWQAEPDVCPRAAAVGTLQGIRGEVTLLVLIDDHIDGVRIVQIRLDVVDEEERLDARQGILPPPGLAPVLADLYQAVVGAGVQQPLDEGGLGQRRDRAVLGHGKQIPGGIPAPDPAHHRLGEPVDAPGQITADRPPGVAPIVAAPDPLAGEIKARRVMGTDENRSVPVEAVHVLAFPGLRLDVDDFPVLAVIADQVALLPLGINDIRIGGVHGRLMAIAEQGNEPVRVADAVHAVGP